MKALGSFALWMFSLSVAMTQIPHNSQRGPVTDKALLQNLKHASALPPSFYCDFQYPGHSVSDLTQVKLFGPTVEVQVARILGNPELTHDCSYSGGFNLCNVLLYTADKRPFHLQAYVNQVFTVLGYQGVYNFIV